MMNFREVSNRNNFRIGQSLSSVNDLGIPLLQTPQSLGMPLQGFSTGT